MKQFWQIPVYDVERRAMIDNGQRSTISGTDDLKRNADGSVDIYFAPSCRKGLARRTGSRRNGRGLVYPASSLCAARADPGQDLAVE